MSWNKPTDGSGGGGRKQQSSAYQPVYQPTYQQSSSRYNPSAPSSSYGGTSQPQQQSGLNLGQTTATDLVNSLTSLLAGAQGQNSVFELLSSMQQQQSQQQQPQQQQAQQQQQPPPQSRPQMPQQQPQQFAQSFGRPRQAQPSRTHQYGQGQDRPRPQSILGSPPVEVRKNEMGYSGRGRENPYLDSSGDSRGRGRDSYGRSDMYGKRDYGRSRGGGERRGGGGPLRGERGPMGRPERREEYRSDIRERRRESPVYDQFVRDRRERMTAKIPSPHPRSPQRVRSPPRRTSPVRPARSVSPHSERRKSREREPSHEPKYKCYIPRLPVNDSTREYVKLRYCYDQLYVSKDFQKLIPLWFTDNVEPEMCGSTLRKDVNIFCDNETGAFDVEETKEGKQATLASDGRKYNVRVMIMTGVSPSKMAELVGIDPETKEPVTSSEQCEVESGDKHLLKEIEFVTLRKERSQILAVGGSWNKAVDGGDPAEDEKVLLETAKRCCKEQVGLSLDDVSKWVKFIEIQFHRLEEEQRGRKYPELYESTYVYVPILDEIVPDMIQKYNDRKEARKSSLKKQKLEKAKEAREKEQKEKAENPEPDEKSHEKEKEGEAVEQPDNEAKDVDGSGTEKKVDSTKGEPSIEVEPKDSDIEVDESELRMESVPLEPTLYCVTSNPQVRKTKLISLDGLLEYEKEDRAEKTFEVSLFAESFREMLHVHFANRIHSFLRARYEEQKSASSSSAVTGKKRSKAESELTDSTNEEDRRETKKQKTEHQKQEGEEINEIGSVEVKNTNVENDVSMDGKETGEQEENKEQEEKEMKEAKEENADQSQAKMDVDSGEKGMSSDVGEGTVEEKKEEQANAGIQTGAEEEKTEEQKEQRPAGDGRETKEQEQSPSKCFNFWLFSAFRFFDRLNCGYLKTTDIQKILLACGNVTRKEVEEYVKSVTQTDRLQYKPLCEVTVTTAE